MHHHCKMMCKRRADDDIRMEAPPERDYARNA